MAATSTKSSTQRKDDMQMLQALMGEEADRALLGMLLFTFFILFITKKPFLMTAEETLRKVGHSLFASSLTSC